MIERLKILIERLKICWYALTKKEYFFCAIDKRVEGKSGAVAYDNSKDTGDNHIFYDAVIDLCNLLIDRLEKNENT